MRIILIVILFSFVGCNSSPIRANNEKMYGIYKSEFEPSFTDHFPQTLSTVNLSMSCSTYGKKNDIGLLLYEYDLASEEIDSIERHIAHKCIAKYKSSDTCLMIVNRFETKETYENLEQPILSDRTLIDRPCYKKLYPIPNFVSYKYGNLGGGFIMCVLDAKPISMWKRGKLSPSMSMPSQWKNGYSKGVALNKENGSVIYWAITW